MIRRRQPILETNLAVLMAQAEELLREETHHQEDNTRRLFAGVQAGDWSRIQEVLVSSGDIRRFSQRGYLQELSALLEKARVSVVAIPNAPTPDMRYRHGNESERHAQLKANAGLWLKQHGSNPRYETSFGEYRADVSALQHGVICECGDVEAAKVLSYLRRDMRVLLVPFSEHGDIGLLLRMTQNSWDLLKTFDAEFAVRARAAMDSIE